MAVYPLDQLKILSRYINQICSCSHARAVDYYFIHTRESQKLADEVISVFKNRKAA